MNQCIKYFLLQFAFLFAFAGMPSGNGLDASYTLLQAQQAGEHFKGSIAGETLYKFPGIKQAEEQLSVALRLPVAPSKHEPSGFTFSSFAFEAGIERHLAQYIWRAGHFHRSLSSHDIIFPFHYFW